MTEAEWLACTHPFAMLEFVGKKANDVMENWDDSEPMWAFVGCKDRKLRLFATACCRRVWNLLTIEENKKAIEIAEACADGLTERTALEVAGAAAKEASTAARPTWKAAKDVGLAWSHAADAAIATVNKWPSEAGGAAANEAAWAKAWSLAAGATTAKREELEVQTALLRCIFGPLPFRPVTLNAAWITPTVKQLAEAIHLERAFDRLPILADALEEAGCTDADILIHCRQLGEHVRGCWAVDLVLGKK